MRLSRIITALVAGLAVAGAPTAAGAAQPYPPQPPALTATDPTVSPGEPTTLIGTGFGPNELVRLDFAFTPLAARAPGSAPGRQDTGGVGAMVPVAYQAPADYTIPSITVRADGDGRFTRVVEFSRQGRITVTATGLTTGRVATYTISVVRAQPGLPVTGGDLGTPLTVGTGLLVAGVLMVLLTVLWRRRNRRNDNTPKLGSLG
jgi:hypothetical protein